VEIGSVYSTTGALKMQDLKMTDKNRGLENTGLENDGPLFASHTSMENLL